MVSSTPSVTVQQQHFLLLTTPSHNACCVRDLLKAPIGCFEQYSGAADGAQYWCMQEPLNSAQQGSTTSPDASDTYEQATAADASDASAAAPVSESADADTAQLQQQQIPTFSPEFLLKAAAKQGHRIPPGSEQQKKLLANLTHLHLNGLQLQELSSIKLCPKLQVVALTGHGSIACLAM